MLCDLESFIHTDNGFDSLIQMALVHYQFEAIHPVFDGNGRTGRIITILCLTLYGLLDLPVLYLSRYIVEHKTEYYERLRYVTENDEWVEWISFMLDGVAQAGTPKGASRQCKTLRRGLSFQAPLILLRGLKSMNPPQAE